MRTPALMPLVDAYVRSCFARHSPPQTAELAAYLGISRSRLATRFREEGGVTPAAYLKGQQINCAKELLRTSRLSNETIAPRAAFSNRRTFQRAFLRATGMTPAAYRRRPKGF